MFYKQTNAFDNYKIIDIQLNILNKTIVFSNWTATRCDLLTTVNWYGRYRT